MMAGNQIKIETNKTGELVEVVLSGEMILSEMELIRQELSNQKIKQGSKITIRMEEVTEVDLSFLQVLKAFAQKVDSGEGDVAYGWPENDEMIGLLKRAGFSSFFNLDKLVQ